MKTIDIILLVPLVWGTIRGFTKGFILELASLSALILGIWLGFLLINEGIDLMTTYFNLEKIDETYWPYISFLLIFILVVVGVYFIGRFLKTVVHLTPLGIVDRMAGGVFGLFRWAFIIGLLLWINQTYGMAADEAWIAESLFYDKLMQLPVWLYGLFGSSIPKLSDLPQII